MITSGAMYRGELEGGREGGREEGGRKERSEGVREEEEEDEEKRKAKRNRRKGRNRIGDKVEGGEETRSMRDKCTVNQSHLTRHHILHTLDCEETHPMGN